MEAAATLGAGPFDAFFSVAAPLARPGFVVAAVLAFAHTLGEFGVVLMIGGGVPGETEVLSIEMFRLVEALEWEKAHLLAGGLVIFAFVTVLGLLVFDRRTRRVGR
jgi:molybdate transport system permease protein